MTNKLIDEIRNNLDNGNVTSEMLFEEATSKAKKYQDEYNSFVTIMDNKEELEGNSILRGIPYALKDNISTKGILTTASSNILKDYIPLYNATIYKKLKESGAVLMGKSVLDELAMGGTGTTGHTGIVRNPWNKERMIGGSSAGSAAAVALGIVPFAIGSDTGDSIRKPAAYGGVVGYKPTYGRISRYGLFAFASSLDHLGVFARSVKDVSYVMDIVKGHDEKDMTSLPDEDILYVDNIDNDIKGKKLFYIKEIVDKSKYTNSNTIKIIDDFNKLLDTLKDKGYEIYEESMDENILKALKPVYTSISCAEVTSNNSNLTGISFGHREKGESAMDVIKNFRTKNFSSLIKRRFVIGSFILQKENQEKYFINAKKVRRVVVNTFNELFTKYDGLILPAQSDIAPKICDTTDEMGKDENVLDNHLVIGNFGGYPSITLPCNKLEGMPVGINITSGFKNDSYMLAVANDIEKIIKEDIHD